MSDHLGHVLSDPIRRPNHPLLWPTLEHIAERFHEAYRKLYVRIPDGREIQVVTVRVRRIGRVAKVELPEWKDSRHAPPAIDASQQLPVTSRSDLVGKSLPGPFLLVDAEATTYVPPDWQAAGSSDGVVLLTRR